MIYIIELSNPGIEPDSLTASYLYYDSIDDAIDMGEQYKSCHGTDIVVKIYEALNEYTNKRKLIRIIE